MASATPKYSFTLNQRAFEKRPNTKAFLIHIFPVFGLNTKSIFLEHDDVVLVLTKISKIRKRKAFILLHIKHLLRWPQRAMKKKLVSKQKTMESLRLSLHKKCPYSGLFWSVFSRIRTEYEEIRNISLYSVRMQENTDQNNSEYRPFSRNVSWLLIFSHIQSKYGYLWSLFSVQIRHTTPSEKETHGKNGTVENIK